MNRNLKNSLSAKLYRRRKPAKVQARRRLMSIVPTPLEERIADILREAHGRPLSLLEIEQQLAQDQKRLDTFVVRDAVWNLIRKQRAHFTPRLLVQAVES
jgi:hypothetical protein